MEDEMNIIILNHHAGIGKYGSQSRHYTMSKYLSTHGNKVLLVSSSYNHRTHEYIHEENIKKEKINENFYYISIKSSPSYKKNFLRIINYLNFTYKTNYIEPFFKPDVIVGSSVHPFVWISAYRLSKKYECEFHIEIRDIWPLSLYEELPSKVRNVVFRLSELYEKFYYKKAKSIIVTAPLTNKYLQEKFGIENSKVNYVPHGIDLVSFDKFKHNNIPNEIIKKALKEKIAITYAGALSASEGLENFIALAEKFRNTENLHFHVFGEGNQHKKLLDIVNEKKLNNISFHGHFDGKFIPWILSNSDILWCGLKNRKVFKYSISKNKFYDYLASEKPIIFHSNVIESSLQQSGAAYIIKLDKLPIEELSELLSNEKHRISLGEKGRKFVEREHDISIISNKYISTFYNN